MEVNEEDEVDGDRISKLRNDLNKHKARFILM